MGGWIDVNPASTPEFLSFINISQKISSILPSHNPPSPLPVSLATLLPLSSPSLYKHITERASVHIIVLFSACILPVYRNLQLRTDRK